MKWIKRIGLFFLVNALVILTVSFLLSFFNVQPYLTHYGLNVKDLFIFCLVWGMAGSLISLMLSRKMAKWLMGVKLIDPQNAPPQLASFYYMVEELAGRAGLPTPQVGLFSSNDLNAFATGPSKRHSLVAVSTALLERLAPHEIEAVVAHEMTHIANGDMVTMTLLQGVVNAFVMFFARLLAFALTGAGRSNNRRGSSFAYYGLVFLFEFVFMLLGWMVIAAFSRYREYRADAGGASLAGTNNMIAALRRLETARNEKLEGSKRSLAPLMIQSETSLLFKLFSTHPPISKRVQCLEASSSLLKSL